ncbi:MAG: MerR family transcriptional regulator [bacterium]|nr:MerR family transcriptional regulator [bacterium]
MFTIGEFSRLCCISARMLRHYDAIGLLHPKSSGLENGYRYYDRSQQFEIEKIERLKDYDFTLEEIKVLMPLSKEELTKQLTLQLPKLLAKKQHYEEMIHRLEAELSHKEDCSMKKYHVITMSQKQQNVLFIKRMVNVYSSDFHQLAKDLQEKLEKEGLTRTGPIQICYLDPEFNPEHAMVEMQVEVSSNGADVKVIPENLCVTTIHTGPMAEIPHAYQAILRWMDEHPEYKLNGSSFERMIKDEHMVESDEELETAVLFPIELK